MPRSRRSPRYATLCGLLAAARQGAGVTQIELAEKLGRPQSYVSKFEAGERRLDVVEFLEVAEALGSEPAPMIAALLKVKP